MKDQLCGQSVFLGRLPGELDRNPEAREPAPYYSNTFCSLLTPPGVMDTASGGLREKHLTWTRLLGS